MKKKVPKLDPIFFAKRKSWGIRVQNWLNQYKHTPEHAFLESNKDRIRHFLENSKYGLRMVVNISAELLLSFLKDNKYKNIYDKPIVFGIQRKPSATRLKVDRLQGLGEKARLYYVGAANTGGAGIRFYGEYCMVLRQDKIPATTTRMFDRNPYDLIEPPLNDLSDHTAIARVLRGFWGRDRLDMITLKVLPRLRGMQRLITAGILSEEILRDEDFIEVQKQGTFTPKDLHEIRTLPAESIIEQNIETRFENGILPTLTEMEWVRRRRMVNKELSKHGIQIRMITTGGRDQRWG